MAGSYRDRLRPRSVPARLGGEIMKDWLSCAHFHFPAVATVSTPDLKEVVVFILRRTDSQGKSA